METAWIKPTSVFAWTWLQMRLFCARFAHVAKQHAVALTRIHRASSFSGVDHEEIPVFQGQHHARRGNVFNQARTSQGIVCPK
jgi:hypothetical protein